MPAARTQTFDSLPLLFALRFTVVENAKSLFALIVEDFVCFEVVLLGLTNYAVVFFCAKSGRLYDEVGGGGVVVFHG